MFQGKTKAALDIPRNKDMGCVDDHTLSGNGRSVSVRQILNEKHHPGQLANPDTFIYMMLYTIPLIQIRSAALKTS